MSTGRLRSLLVAGSATATFLGATALAQSDVLVETAVAPPPAIITTAPIVIDSVIEGETAVVINTDPIPQVIIPEPVTSSRSSR